MQQQDEMDRCTRRRGEGIRGTWDGINSSFSTDDDDEEEG